MTDTTISPKDRLEFDRLRRLLRDKIELEMCPCHPGDDDHEEAVSRILSDNLVSDPDYLPIWLDWVEHAAEKFRSEVEDGFNERMPIHRAKWLVEFVVAAREIASLAMHCEECATGDGICEGDREM